MSLLKTPLINNTYRMGNKKLYLPKFKITLVHTPNHSPYFASFIVPLNLNKLDLRDYLWNMYNLPVLNVRSYIQQQKIQQDRPGAARPSPRKWHRPKSIKRMMVEMEKPFVWPVVTDFEQWDKKTFEAANAEREEEEKQFRPDHREQPTKERASMREQAKLLLEGKETWRPTPGKDEWVDDGEEVEVEEDVDIRKIER